MTTAAPSFEGDLLECREALLRSARRLFRQLDDANDAVQATLLRALERRDQFNGGCMSCWLHRILTSVFYNRQRDAKRLRFTGELTYADHLADRTDLQASLEAREALAAIATRPDADILVQAGFGVSNEDIAAQFNMRADNVRKIISRGRTAIKKALI